jgi:hypothetical protein
MAMLPFLILFYVIVGEMHWKKIWGKSCSESGIKIAMSIFLGIFTPHLAALAAITIPFVFLISCWRPLRICIWSFNIAPPLWMSKCCSGESA